MTTPSPVDIGHGWHPDPSASLSLHGDAYTQQRWFETDQAEIIGRYQQAVQPIRAWFTGLFIDDIAWNPPSRQYELHDEERDEDEQWGKKPQKSLPIRKAQKDAQCQAIHPLPNTPSLSNAVILAQRRSATEPARR